MIYLEQQPVTKPQTFAHTIFLAALFPILALSLIACEAEAEPTLTPSPTVAPAPTPTVAPSPTLAVTVAPAPTPTVAPSPTLAVTVAPAPMPTVAPSPTVAPAPMSTVTPAPMPTPTPEPTPTITPTPTPISKQDILDYVRWEIGSEVSLADQQNARYAVQLMHDYAVSLGLPTIEKDITFHLYHNHDALFETYARVTGLSVNRARDQLHDGNSAGMNGDGWLFVNTSGRWFRGDSYPSKPLKIMSVSAGEYLGALNYALSELSPASGLDEVPLAGPRWLKSGVGAFLKDRALAEGGVISYDTARNGPRGLVEQAKYAGKQPLSEMETATGFRGVRSPYKYAAMAGELLASLAGESSLIRYYANLKIGTTWQKEFQRTFGMTVDKFYDLFEEHRAAGFPELDVSK